MTNRNSSAETDDDSSTQHIINSSADIEANPMLGEDFFGWITCLIWFVCGFMFALLIIG
jgi:hypothetical protein